MNPKNIFFYFYSPSHHMCLSNNLLQSVYLKIHIYLTNRCNTYFYISSARSACSLPSALPSLTRALLHFHCSWILPDTSSPWSFATSSTPHSMPSLCSLNPQNSFPLALLQHLQAFLLQHDMCITKKACIL